MIFSPPELDYDMALGYVGPRTTRTTALAVMLLRGIYEDPWNRLSLFSFRRVAEVSRKFTPFHPFRAQFVRGFLLLRHTVLPVRQWIIFLPMHILSVAFQVIRFDMNFSTWIFSSKFSRLFLTPAFAA